MKERFALYLQDAHDLRDGLEYVSTLKRRDLKRFGKRKAVWFAMPSCPWPLTQPLLKN